MTVEEKKEYCLKMANVMWQSLFCSVDVFTVLSWGISQKTALYFKDMPSLQFKVNGMLHKGFVVISYDEGADLFAVSLLDKNKTCARTLDNIYADMLGSCIDENIERPKDTPDSHYRAAAIRELVQPV